MLVHISFKIKFSLSRLYIMLTRDFPKLASFDLKPTHKGQNKKNIKNTEYNVSLLAAVHCLASKLLQSIH